MTLETKAKTLSELNDICDDLAEVYCGTEFCVKQQQHLNQKYVPLEEAQQLEADLKRANKKLSTIDAVAKQLVHMTNIATELQIQIDKANKILEKIHGQYCCWDCCKKDLESLREVLK
jgi:septal ring factor EnvC (AmiA/AmiB activator)